MHQGKHKKIVIPKDCFIGSAIVVLGIVVLVNALQYRELTKMVPTIIGIAMPVIGLIMIIVSFKAPYEGVGSLAFTLPEVLIFIILFATAYLMKVLGFYTSVFLGLAVINYIILQNLKRKALFSFIISLGINVLLYVVFQHILFIPTPRGLFI